MNAVIQKVPDATVVNRLNAEIAFQKEFFLQHALLEKYKIRRLDKFRLAQLRSSSSYADAFLVNEPLVSIIVATVNRAKIIVERTVPSMIAQDYENWEMIIVGDCMDEADAVLLRKLKDPRIHFHNLKTRGAYPSYRGPRWYVAGTKPANFGLRIARGSWVSHLDDDDEYTTNHISALLIKAKSEQAEWVHGKVMFVSDDAQPNVLIGEAIPALGRISKISSLYHAGLKTFRFNPNSWKYACPGDWDYWERFMEMGVAHAHLPEIVAIHHGGVSDILGEYTEVSSLPAVGHLPTDEPTKLKVALLSVDHINYACINLRILSPAKYLGDKIEIQTVVNQSGPTTGQIDTSVIDWADLIIVQRGFPTQDTMPLLDQIFMSSKPVVYEMDDLLGCAIPERNPHRGEFLEKEPYMRDTIKRADLVTTSTRELANEYKDIRSDIWILPNLIDPTCWPVISPSIKDEPILIGFAGTSTHAEDLEMIEDALVKIAKKYQNRVRIVCMGFATDKIRSLPGFQLAPFVPYDEFPKAFQKLSLDIGIAPLVNNKFNRCKSHLKWLEYSISGVAGIYSDLPPYNSSVQHGITGLLVGASEQDWFSALDQLICDAELRLDLVRNAQNEITKMHSMELGAQQYFDVWRNVARREKSGQIPNTAETLADDDANSAYRKWVEMTAISEGQAQVMAERMLVGWTEKPSFHVLMLANPGEEALIADTLESLSEQLYAGWGLSIISVAPMPSVFVDAAANIEWIQNQDAPWQALHQTINETGADWIIFITPGDSFEAHGLYSFADYINIHPEWSLIYCDHDTRTGSNARKNPLFKPDFNLELLRSRDYIGSACVIKRTILEQLGGFSDLAYVFWQDLVLKVYERFGETAIGHISNILFHETEYSQQSKDPKLVLENERIIRYEHFLRSNLKAELKPGLKLGCHNTVYLHNDKPLVSIIIPTKDRADLIIPCVDSLLAKTSYPNYEIIIVDNGSVVDDVHDYYAKLIQKYPKKICLLEYRHPFNFSAMNNYAASEANGEYLLLLNNDTEILHGDWLGNMMNQAQCVDVGIVGARLIYQDKLLQHAGVILGVGSVAGHGHYQQPMDKDTPFFETFVDRDVSAVTGACLLIPKELFDDVNGLDDEQLKVAFNDVDLCLKVRAKGLRIIWTPFATLIHQDSSSRSVGSRRDETTERFANEADVMLQRWLPQLAQDPAYNRNLSLMSSNASADYQLVPGWNLDFHDLPRVLGFPLDGLGCGYYRIYAPLWALEDHCKAEVAFIPEHDKYDFPRIPNVTELERLAPDTLLLQSTLKDNQLAVLEQYKKFSTTFKVFDLDDLKTNLPDSNSRKKSMYKDMKYRLRRGLGFCDRLIVSTEPLKQAYQQWIDDVVIVPNRLEKSRWSTLEPMLNDAEKPRVGWAGAQQHHGDLRILIDVIKATYKEIDWVFFGMCLDELRPYIAEEHSFVSPNDYPAKLASLKLDLAVAPLEKNPFNEAKSNLRLLEYGVMGWPVVCTDIYPYQSAPVARVGENATEWVDAIMDRVKNRDLLKLEGQRLKRWVNEKWMLEDFLDEWLTALSPASVSQENKSRAVH